MKKLELAVGIVVLLIISLILFIFMSKTPKTPVVEPAETVSVSAVIETTLGTMKAELCPDKAPETVKNFVELAKAGKYDGVIFHRVIKDFMIQTGDFERQNGTGGYSYKGVGTKIPDEFGAGLTHSKGTLSMANSGPNTGGSQFFIVQADDGTPWLDGKHSIFGRVIEGLEIVDKIANVATAPGDRPLEEVKMIKVTIE